MPFYFKFNLLQFAYITVTCNPDLRQIMSEYEKMGNELTEEITPPTLQKLFGDSSVARVLDFLTLYREYDYPLTDIAEKSGIAWKTLHNIWPTLEKYDLVRPTRQIGRAKLFKLNTESAIVKLLTNLTIELASIESGVVEKEEIERIPNDSPEIERAENVGREQQIETQV